jgi:hypothetical protein
MCWLGIPTRRPEKNYWWAKDANLRPVGPVRRRSGKSSTSYPSLLAGKGIDESGANRDCFDRARGKPRPSTPVGKSKLSPIDANQKINVVSHRMALEQIGK